MSDEKTEATATTTETAAEAPAGGEAKKATVEDVKAVLQGILDPELYISIMDLGLVYETRLEENGDVYIKHTLTSPGCPVGPLIQQQVHGAISRLPGVTDVKVELTFDPPWDPKTMCSDDAKDRLGLW
jgi:metal-sulfur cluster biosynthetic enzyme